MRMGAVSSPAASDRSRAWNQRRVPRSGRILRQLSGRLAAIGPNWLCSMVSGDRPKPSQRSKGAARGQAECRQRVGSGHYVDRRTMSVLAKRANVRNWRKVASLTHAGVATFLARRPSWVASGPCQQRGSPLLEMAAALEAPSAFEAPKTRLISGYRGPSEQPFPEYVPEVACPSLFDLLSILCVT